MIRSISQSHLQELDAELRRLDVRDPVDLAKNVAAIQQLAQHNPAAQALVDRIEGLVAGALHSPDVSLRRVIDEIGTLLSRLPERRDVETFGRMHGLISIETARARLDRLDPNPKPPAAGHTQQIAGESYHGEAWDLYGAAKKSRAAGDFELASAQLDVALALYTNLRASADSDRSLNVAENRLGMILHQHGLIALAQGKESVHADLENAALEKYRAVIARPEVDPPYRPAPWMNSICSNAQLGDIPAVMSSIDGMVAACGSSEQLDTMIGVVMNDDELKGSELFHTIGRHLREAVARRLKDR